MRLIRNTDQLAEFRDEFDMRHDWHEPDEQGISARIEGDHLDNACGASGRCGEFVVVLTHEGDYQIREDVAQVNLADLLAWASS